MWIGRRTSSPPLAVAKARVLATSLGDLVVDLVLPTLVYLASAPLELDASIRLTVGGFFVAAKAVAGRVDDDSATHVSITRRFLLAALIAFGCAAVSITVARTGHSDAMAIAAGTAGLVVSVGATLLRGRRRLDAFAVLVLVEIAATVVLTSVSTDPRFILVRPSFYTAIAGAYVLCTIGAARPFMMQVSKAVAAGGDPVRAVAFERAGRESTRFRRVEQAMTAGLGVVLLAEAALRIVAVYSRPEGAVLSTSLLSQLPAIGLLVGYFVVIRIFAVPAVSREVDALMPADHH